MKTLVIYLGLAAIGYMIAIPLRKSKKKLKWVDKLLAVVIITIVFAMGFKIGSNKVVLGDLGTIGMNSVIIALVSLLCTIAAMHIARKAMGFNEFGLPIKEEVKEAGKEKNRTLEAEAFETETPTKKKKSLLSNSSVRIAISVLAGFISGYVTVVQHEIIKFEAATAFLGIYITYALFLMVFIVGIGLGLEGTIIATFKNTGIKVMAFPVIIAITTVLSVAVCGTIMGISLKESAAVACTFCWYSFGPNVILDAGMDAAGAIAFLSNFGRVIISMFTIPLVAKKVGYIETIGMPVAAAMDVCIGIIDESTNSDTVAYAFASGTVFTVLVPLLMPIVVNL